MITTLTRLMFSNSINVQVSKNYLIWSGSQHEVYEISNLVVDCVLTVSKSTSGIQNIFPQKQSYMWLLGSWVGLQFNTNSIVIPNDYL